MNENEIREHAFAMPFNAPSFPQGPYRFINREFFIISYETDEQALRQAIPAPLEFVENIVKFEFIRMPDSTGFGSYTESGQVIPVSYNGDKGVYVNSMFLDDHVPIAGGRELWGFPKKLATPKMQVDKDTLIASLDYGKTRIAHGTMGYKHNILSPESVRSALNAPNFLLKIIPDVNGKARICELVRYYLTDINIKGVWSGPGTLELHPHALAPIANLPIRRIISAIHIMTDLTLPYGEVVYDYLK